MDRDKMKAKKPTSIRDKFNSLMTGEKKRKSTRFQYGDLESLEQLHRFQATINKLSEQEVNSRFEQMLDDMDLTEEKKTPLRLRSLDQKRGMLAMQFKGMQSHGKMDTVEEFIGALNRNDLKGSYRYEVVSSLRVALTNNPVSWVINFVKKQGLTGILKCLSFSCDDRTERRSTLECIKCLRTLSNNKYGLMQLIKNSEAMILLSRCVDTRDLQSLLEAVKLLAAICLVPPNGHEKVLEGMWICGEMRSTNRFLSVILGLQVKDAQTKAACLQLINAVVSSADDLDFRLHLRNEIMRDGLIDLTEGLEQHPNEEVSTQIKIFLEQKEEDAEEFSHRYDNIRFFMDDPKECFEILYNSTLDTPCEGYLLSILQHLLTIRDDELVKPLYYQLIEECITQIILHKNGFDPDFRYNRRFQIDVDPLIGKLLEEMSEEGSSTMTGPRHFRHKFDEAITAKQESEAKVSSLEEKLRLQEEEIKILKAKIFQEIGSTVESALINIPSPTPPPLPGQSGIPVPPPPPMAGIPVAPPGPPGMVPPPPLGMPLLTPANRIPSFVRPKKKYNPSTQMKRANWTKISLATLEKSSFWSLVNEDKHACEDLFNQLLNTFAFKSVAKSESTSVSHKQLKKVKELKVLDAKAGQNLSILLGSIKVPYEEIKRRIVEMDEEKLTLPFVEQLIKLLPTQDLINKLVELKDQYDTLSEPEQFGVVLSNVKRVVPRLSSTAFKMKFNEVVSEVKPDIVAAMVAMEEVKESKKFGELLEIILLFGNFMNAGSRNEQTIGFELSFIPKLINTKSTDNSKTLMHFLIEYLERKNPNLLDFPHELIHAEKAARVSEDSIQKNLSLMNKGLKQLEIDIKIATKDKTTPHNDTFVKVMNPFLEESKDQYEVLEGMFKKMLSQHEGLATYFCYNPKKYTMDEFFADIKLFVDHFEQSKRDLQRMRDVEEKQTRARQAQETRERDRAEKLARKKLFIDMNAADDQEGVMDNLLEALKTGSAFNMGRERKDGKKRTPRVAGAERRAQLARSRSRQNVLSPESGETTAEIQQAKDIKNVKITLFTDSNVNKESGYRRNPNNIVQSEFSKLPPTGLKDDKNKSNNIKNDFVDRDRYVSGTPKSSLSSPVVIVGRKEDKDRTDFWLSSSQQSLSSSCQPPSSSSSSNQPSSSSSSYDISSSSSTPGMSEAQKLLERLRAL